MAAILETYSVFVIAGTVYGALTWFGTYHISRETKDEMALWLLGAYDDTWQKYYSEFFDAVFGRHHFTISCFLKSSALSIVAAMVIYGSFTHFGTADENRFQENLSTMDILILAVVINVLPDYISLLETRILIRLFSRYRAFSVQLMVLLADVVASGLIIFAFISGYRLANGLAPITLVEMVGFFSVYSVFFYTTFLTSFWAWLFVLSSATLKIARGLRIERILNVWGNAPAQISLFISIYIFIFLSLLAPATARDDELRATAFDAWLCDIASSAACPHVLRLSGDQQEKLKIRIRLCGLGRGKECFEAARSFHGAGELPRALELFNNGCQVENAQSCLAAAAIVAESNLASTFDSRGYASKACALEDGDGCALYGQLSYNTAETNDEELRALAILQKGCSLNSSAACVAQAWMIENGRGVSADPRRARVLYREACGAGNANGCYLLGEHLEFGRTGIPNPKAAKIRYSQACDLEHVEACGAQQALSVAVRRERAVANRQLISPWEMCNEATAADCVDIGLQHHSGMMGRSNPLLAFRFFEAACTMKDPNGCILLGRMRQIGDGIAMDLQGAVAAFRSGCNLGEQTACLEAEIHSSASDVMFLTRASEQYLRYLIALCDTGDEGGCERLEHLESNALFNADEYYTEKTCSQRGYENCRHLREATGSVSIP